jgi:hypothetical protein
MQDLLCRCHGPVLLLTAAQKYELFVKLAVRRLLAVMSETRQRMLASFSGFVENDYAGLTTCTVHDSLEFPN